MTKSTSARAMRFFAVVVLGVGLGRGVSVSQATECSFHVRPESWTLELSEQRGDLPEGIEVTATLVALQASEDLELLVEGTEAYSAYAMLTPEGAHP